MATKKVNEELQNNMEVVVEEKPKKKRNLSDKTKKLNAIDFEYMVEYIEKNAPKDQEWFMEVAFEGEKYKHFKARNAFVARYMPELSAPQKKSKWDILKERKWVK